MFATHAYQELLRRPGQLGIGLTVVEEVGSTNDWIKEAVGRLTVADRPPSVLAIKQTEGRGRRGRRWFLPEEGGLAFSFGWPLPEAMINAPGPATLVAGAALAAASHALTGAPPGLKYPNDLLVNGKKAGGVLAERANGADGRPWAVVGIGVNLSGVPDEENFDEECPLGAASVVSLAEEPVEISREQYLAAFFNAADYLYGRLAKGDLTPALDHFRRYDITKGKRVTVTGMGDPFTGVADGVDDAGALLVRTDDEVKTVLSGEVRFDGLSSGEAPR